MGVREGDITRGGPKLGEPSSLSVAAHELKTPLVLIRQLTLELDDESLSPSQRQRISDQIVHASEQALRLTSNLTKSQQLQTRLFPLEPLDPMTICDEVRYGVSSLFKLHGRDMKKMRSYGMPLIVANHDLLRRVLLNFADNALYYGGDSTVEIHAQVVKKRKYVRLSVRDYGGALSLGKWKAMLSTTTASNHPLGSGLGLQIAHQFAGAMNGTVGAKRHRNGATFYIELPISRQLRLL